MCRRPAVRGEMRGGDRTVYRGSQSPNLFEMMSRSKRKRWTDVMPGALVLYLTLLCLFPGIAKAQERATTNDINLFVDENQPAGTYVGSVAEEGATTSNSYSFLSSPPNEFHLNSTTGIITTLVSIDRELLTNDLFILPVAVASSSATNIVDIKITVNDLNDNSPVFPQPVITVSFSENAHIGSVQILPSAMDADKDSNGYISTYQIESVSGGSGDGVFSLQTFRPREDAEYTVSLATNSLLDRETEDFYILNISATDNSSTPRTGYLIVNVTINDVNDNSPIFTQTTYFATVNESSATGSSVVRLNATDIDQGSNGEVVYRLKNEQSENFALDPDTGWITLLRQLPFIANGYQFEVTATDRGSPSQSSSAFVNVMVEDENDHNPVIQVLIPEVEATGVASISETVMPGPFLTLRATDDDREDNGRVSLNIYSGNERNDFSGNAILTPTGDAFFVLRVAATANIDREITASYNLTFVAEDMGTPPLITYRSIIVYVVDENDHAPVFLRESYHARLSESIQIGSFVESVTATDADEGINAAIVYSITADEYGWFQIDNGTGLVTTRGKLDHEMAAQVTLTITASDQGLEPMSNTTTLTIDILDENDEYPVFNQTTYTETVEENSPARNLIQVLATDLDNGVNGEVTYTISSDQYDGMFSLDPNTGLLRIIAPLDREEQEIYELEIIASDGGSTSLQATATVTIAVLDQNDNSPQFYPLEYYANVIENGPAGLFVTMVSATDLDVGVNGALTFSLSGSNKFLIDSLSGNVTTRESLDREEEASYTLTVTVQDGGGQTALESATIFISVTDTLDNPLEFELNPYRFQLQENRPNRTEVGTVLATSMDLNVDITYAIVNGDPNGLFVIGFISGVIQTTRSIDREASESASFRLSVLAVDGSQNGQTVVEIEILDINDNAPVFALLEDQVDVVENWAVGYEFYAAEVTDADSPPNNVILYDISVNFDNRFGINHTSGVLFLNKDLQSYPEKEYNLEIQATDYGTPPLSSSMNLLITIRDVNNNAPVFADSINTTLRLTESIPVNMIFIHALATDADQGTNGEIIYRITSGNTADSFGIFPNGMVYVKRALDREEVDKYDLTIEATDGGVPSMSSSLMLEIFVIDENDNRPFFDNATYNFYLQEEDGIGAAVGTIHAVDNDVGGNGELTYSFTANHTLFALNSVTGAITSKVSLDRESLVAAGQPTTFSIRVRVRDGGQPQLQDHADVYIHVVDINDNPPEFNRESYQASVSELADNETLIIRVSATDDDVGDNSYLLYSIVDGNEEGRFHIDHVSGQIVLIAPLDREVTDSYVLRVKARDGGNVPQESFVDVEVSVLDENDHRPSFDSNVASEIEVTECLEIGDTIGFVEATDMDINSNGRILYTITGGNLDGVFGVNPSSGEIYLTGLLDHEATSQYSLNITARDGGSPSLLAVASLVINIRDCNDNSPIFAYVGVPEIDEEEDVGYQVVRVSASDSDSGVNGDVRFSISNQQPAGDFFAIDSDSGWITTNGRIDRESEVMETGQFILTIHATDLAVPVESRRTATVDVVIFVRDINDNAPRFTSQQAAVISRSTSTNTRVTTVHADDPDTGVNGQVTYTLVSTGVPFRLDLNSGELTLTQSIPSAANVYSLEIRAQDSGSNPQQQTTTFTLTIIVSDAQSSVLSYVQNSYTGSVAENRPAGTEIVNVVAQYSDGRSASVRYYVSAVTAGGMAKGSLIVASPTNGIIRTGAVLDREDLGGGSTLVATVYAVDTSSSSSHVRSVQVTINVLDENDNAPVFRNGPYIASIMENVDPNSPVWTVMATDADLDTIISYSIIDGATDLFSIDSTTGEITTRGAVDREASAVYQLLLQASDGTLSSTTTIDINLLDQNDNDPQFSMSPYSFLVPEDEMVGEDVGVVVATDPDVGLNGEVVYSVVEEGAPGEDVFYLDPSSGAFRLQQSLDYEMKQHYFLTVMATDKGSSPRSSTATVYINVEDVNDNTPVYNPVYYSEEVPEDVAIGTSVVTLTANDLDSGLNGELEFSIISGDPSQRFSVYRNGTIVTIKNLDREAESFYNLEVVASDMTLDPSDRRSSTAQVSIIVTDINDNAPRFTNPDSVEIDEDTRNNVIIMVLRAEDDDVERNSYVEYYLLTPGVPFAVSRVEGNMQVTGPLDRETESSYTLLVQATDKGTPPQSSTMNVTIYITDVNDNAPAFSNTPYQATLDEDTPIGLEFLKVTASDSDQGLNSIIRYSIFSGDNGRFNIDAVTGVISVNSGLDYEQRSSYLLTVRAQDQGYSTQVSSITVTIAVTDVNDNAPVFEDSYAPSIIENNLPNADIVQVVADDADSSANGIVNFRLESDYNGLFTIGSSSGQVQVTDVLDYEDQNVFELIVIAEDSGTPSHQTRTTMTLTVNDDNDHDPAFVADFYRATVSEDANPDTFVIQVTATDVDATADLRYQLNDDIGSKFTIDPLEGRIITSGVLDREVQASYLLTVTVRDGPTRQATTSVQVEVLDVNDNPPQFSTSSFTATLPATTTQGRFVAAVQASDADLKDNALITYSITSGDTTKFQVDPETGVVFTAQSLTNEINGYDLQITAQNVAGGQNPAVASLRVEFSTASFPVITFPSSGTSSSYSENVQRDMTVTTVTATGAVTFSIAGGNHGNHFGVGSQSGVVSIVKEFDYEMSQSFSLWIAASDTGNAQLADSVELQIAITDVNDNAPVFDQSVYFASVVEEQSGQVQVVAVSATDEDSLVNGDVSYAITLGNTNNVFDISSSGVITTMQPLDRETVASYILTVEATDGGNPSQSGSAIVVVTVTDINDNRMSFTRTYDATIPENAAPGTHVVTLHTTDPDENNLSLFSIETQPSLFAINPMTGEITLNSSLDFEDEVIHYLLVKAFDPDSSHEVQTQVTVNVEDTNDNAPVFTENLINVTYPESFFSSDRILTILSATDADEGNNGEVDYILKTMTDHFRIETNVGRGWIKPVDPISYIVPSPDDTSNPNTYIFSVFAVDRGTPALYGEATVIITVTQDNSYTPVFSALSYFSPVTEDTRQNTRVLQVEAVDEDTGSNAEITYSIVDGNGTAKFDIEEDTGWIVTRGASLAGDVGIIYQLIVKASDNGNFKKDNETTVTLLVTDSNDYAPVFDDDTYRSSIAEDVGGYVTTVHADDDDSGINGEVTYSISGVDAALFSIDATSGIVSLVGSLDREMANEHQIQVIAVDSAMNPQSATAMLTVTVTDVDDNAPVFLPREYRADVFENSPSATPVVTVTATDADIGSNAEFEYVITGGDGTDFFTINPENGLILTQGNLDYESGKTNYYLTVAATNEEASMVDYAHVVVTLLGKNEFYPQFTQHQYDFYVNEHATDGAPVGIVLATDTDLGDDGVVNYLFIGGSNSQGFEIDPVSGQITVSYENGRLDRETADTVLLSVLAKNEGPINGADIDEAEVIVHINDGNDAPVFLSEQYQARILESDPPGSDVTVVTAADYDELPSFRQFNYSILEGNVGDAFQIHATTGRITTASDLDRETLRVYFLTVAAIDTGNPPQTGTAVVSVELDDVNDNGPVFEGDAAEGSVFENEPSNELVMTLLATDPDANPDPTQFSYTLLTSPDSSAFRLVGDQLRTTQTLDREVKADYYLQIEASDGESPAMTATSTIHVTVADRNDNPSTLRQARIEVKMFQSNFPGGVIGSVKPIDPDTDDTFFCQITSGDLSKFSIQSNCDLFSAAHSTESTLDLAVSGNDGLHQSVTSSFSVVYESFTNATLINSVTLRLTDTSAEEFLSESYDRFKTSLSAFLGSRETLIVLGITDHPDVNKVDLILAIKKQDGQHLLHDDLVDLLEANEATLESQSDIIIEAIDYTACSDSPCLNSGTCSHETNINLDEQITESDPVIFVGLQTTHTYTCACPAEFSGERCEIPTDYCESATCKNGATCQNAIGGYICVCAPGYNGEDCKVEIDECSSNPCINGACQDLVNAFHCECTQGYSGVYCQNGPCSNSPCENGGTCTESGSAFVCQCDNSHWGNRCQYDTIGFQPGSFISRSALPSTGAAVILLEFSTVSSKALLFYNHDSFTNVNAKFVALEILDGSLQLSFNFGSGQDSISASKPVSDGAWHKVEVRMEGTNVDLNILDEDCPRLTADACRASLETSISLAFDGNPLSVGGVYDISELTSRAFQVSAADFVGCMNSIEVNGERLGLGDTNSNLIKGCIRQGCGETSCSDGSVCVDEWWKTWCDCDEQAPGATCAEELNSVSFGGGGRVDYVVKEDYRRQAILDDAKTLARRRRRATGSESVSISFRTGIKDGLLLYLTSDSEFTTLQLTNGSVTYNYGSGSSSSGRLTTTPSSSLTDGEWHNVTLLSSGGQVTLMVDDSQKSATFSNPHEFTGLGLTGMALGGTETALVIDGIDIEGFTGCLDDFQMNGEGLPLDGDSERFEAVPSAGTGNGCTPADLCALNPCNQGEQCVPTGTYYTCVPTTCSPDVCQNGGTCSDGTGTVTCKCADGYSGDYCDSGTGPRTDDGPNIIYIVVPIVIVLLLVVFILAAVYFVRRRSGDMKRKEANQQAALQNPKVSVLNSSVNPGFLGDTFDEATMIGPDGKVNVSGLIHRQTPDIIEQNMAMQQNNSNPSSNSLMMENDTGEHVNIEMERLHPRQLDEAEHYDLENASSLAASDIDVAYHYKHYHDQGNRNRRKKKHRQNQNPMLARIQASPARLSPVSMGSHHNQIPLGNELAHSTPLDSQNPLLRRSPGLHSNYSTNNTLRIGSVPSSGCATPARNVSSPVNSDRSFQSELRSQAHRSDVSSLRSGGKPPARVTTPLSHDGKAKAHSKGRTSKSPLVVGLTAEEVAQLNTARPDLMSGSHASTIEDLSSSSSVGHRGDRLPPHDTPVDPSRLLEPPDSTSDDTNDSFTCSEMNSEYGKHGGFNSTEAAILDRLAEIEHAEDSVLPHVNGALKQKRLDSRGGSLSTLFTSEDENGHSRKEKTNGDVSLERLLGWGPRFDNLVGVFKDIAQLHETNGKIVLQASLTQEEFV